MDEANRRSFFRLGFTDLMATMQVFEVNESLVTEQPRTVSLIDLGGGGLSLRCEEDLPIRLGVYATFTFTLRGQRFHLTGQLVRKTDDMEGFIYGVNFVDVPEAEREDLLSLLLRIQVERSRKERMS